MASRFHSALMLLAVVAAAGLAVILFPGTAYAGVTATVTATSVTVSAACSGPPGATFTITGPDGKSFTASTPKSDTTGLEIAGRAKGTYRFTAMCLNGSSAGSGSFVIAPAGGPMSGDGGKTTGTTGLYTAAALLLAAAACGSILLRRRRATAPR